MSITIGNLIIEGGGKVFNGDVIVSYRQNPIASEPEVKSTEGGEFPDPPEVPAWVLQEYSHLSKIAYFPDSGIQVMTYTDPKFNHPQNLLDFSGTGLWVKMVNYPPIEFNGMKWILYGNTGPLESR